MRAVLVALAVIAVACSASADMASDTWIRGASSSALNDDASAVFVNPAGLGMYEETNTWTSLTMTGESVMGYSLAMKAGAVGFGYQRRFLWEECGCASGGLHAGDDAIDTYVLGLGLGDQRKWSLGVDYRWIRAQFGDEAKTGTWDVGLMVRPTEYLSLGGSVRNLSEPHFEVDAPDASRLALVDEPTRMTYTAGVALRPAGNRLTLMADAALERDGDMGDAVYTAGIETEIADGIVVRGSMQSSPGADGRDQEMSVGLWLTGVSFGVGASYRTMDRVDGDLVSYEAGSSAERMRSLAVSRDGIAEIEIGGALVDAPTRWSLFGGPHTSAQRIMRDIRAAAADPSVGTILLKLKRTERGFLGAPPALAQEIRSEIVRAKRDHGVNVVAFLEYGGELTDYYIATAADRIVLYPISGVDGLGNFVNIMRYTGTSEKLGIEWDYFSSGKYKSTFHSIGAGPLTDEQLEEVDSLVGDNYEEILNALVDGRGFTRDDAMALCQGGVYSAPEALDAGLVDQLGYYEDAKAAAVEYATGETPDDPEAVTTFNVSDWHDRAYDWNYDAKIAVIGAYGGIDTGEGGGDPIRGGQSIGSETLARLLRHVRQDDSVKAVVLRVDSGGGNAIASDIIWRETVKLAEKKPLVVSMADVAASGGYYIAMQADRIFVDPLTITGSIGVVGMKPVMSELYNKIDATHETVKRGHYSDMWSTTRHLTMEEEDMVHGVLDWFYEEFVSRVADARGLPTEKAHELAQGRVYTGNQAVDNGLADELGGLHDAIDYACATLGADRDRTMVTYYREGGSFVGWIVSEAAMKLRLDKLLDLGTDGISDAVQFRMTDGLMD